MAVAMTWICMELGGAVGGSGPWMYFWGRAPGGYLGHVHVENDFLDVSGN